MKEFRGTGVALVTPFDAEHKVDYDGLTKLVNYCIDGGINYLVVMGTTAENPVLNEEEKLQVLKHVQQVNAGRLPIVYGIGGNSTAQVANTIKRTDFEGIDAILSVSPYYNKPTQEGIYQHFKLLSEVSPVPMIIYNVPGRTSSNISSATTLRLANEFNNIIAIKEASGDMEQVMEIIDGRPEGFLVISGDDNLTLPMIACGGDGVISVSGQGFPSVFSKMINDALASNMADARDGHYKLFEITKMLFAEGNPGGIKAVLKEKGICSEDMRLPLWPISEGLRNDLKAEMKKHSI